MQLMQYEITLPADYDMGEMSFATGSPPRIEDGRVPGPGSEAYLVRERGGHGCRSTSTPRSTRGLDRAV